MLFLHFDPIIFAQTIGYLGLFCIIFAESGLFFGFFFPGDSLLFSAGLLSAQSIFNPLFLIIILSFSAILGDSTGFIFGVKIGPKIFSREDSIFFHKRHIERTKKFYEKYGPRTIILARFIPIVRTFAPILAGVGNMNYRKFLSYNIIGGILWTIILVSLGYFLGKLIPNASDYITYIAFGIIIVSLLPIIRELRNKRK